MAAVYRGNFALIFSAVIFGIVTCHTILEEYHCRDSEVQYGVSLKGGKKAGIFRNLGTTKTIQECIYKCCKQPNCDVAMMEGRGKNCIGVRCANDTSCETVPQQPEEYEDLQIAHVTGRGLKNFQIDAKTRTLKTDSFEDKCPHNEVMYNMKLAGGLKAGRFTDIGRVKGINTCIRYCCDSKVDCDLAFMLDRRCFLVKCYTEDKCQTLPASGDDYKFKQRMAFVSPWLFGKKKKIVKVPSSLFSHHVQCVQSKLYSRSRLASGGQAGEFKDVGKVGKPHICTRLCCENPDCDVAYMFGRNCFLVKCYSEESCRVVPDEELQNGMTRNGTVIHADKKCSLDGQIHNSTILEQGMLAGTIQLQKGVSQVDKCIEKCCGEKRCHVALMLGKMCYSMECANENACKPKPAPESILAKNPTVAYVKRGEISMAPKRSVIPKEVEQEKQAAIYTPAEVGN
eukprot:gene12053-13298_t